MIEAVRYSSWAAFAGLFAVFAWTDLRVKKIRNGAVLSGLGLAALGYAALAFWTWRAEGRYFTPDFYAVALRHVAGAWAAALLFWLLKLWPAGDAKLFMMLAALFPLLDPQNPELPWRAVLSTLMNAFIPAALAIVASAFLWLWRTRMVRRLEAAKASGVPPWAGLRLGEAAGEARAKAAAALASAADRPLKTLWAVIDWAGFFASAALLLAVLTARYGQTQWTGLSLCAFSFFVWSALGALMGPGRAVVAWGGVAAALHYLPGLDHAALFSRALHLAVFGGSVGAGVQVLMSWLRGGPGMWWVWGLVPMLLGFLAPILSVSWPLVLAAAFLGAGAAAVAVHVREDSLDWLAESLEPYLVLSAHSLEVIRRDPEFYEEHFETRYADGLTREQADALKAWCAANKVPSLTMQRTLSFAVWIFAGYALTAWLKGSLVQALLRGAA